MKFQQPTNLHFTQGRAIINTTTKILKAAVATLEENDTHTLIAVPDMNRTQAYYLLHIMASSTSYLPHHNSSN